MPPTLGITCDFETYTNRRGMTLERHVTSSQLVEQVARAGGHPVLLPHLEPPYQPRLSVAHLDGLILSGGDFDVPPALYHQAPHPTLGRMRPARTDSELRLLALAEAAALPVLGLCGGMQLINVARGGSLCQDISLRPGTGVHEQPGDTRLPFHRVTLSPGRWLTSCLGAETIEVNSTHHQVIDSVGRDLQIAGRADDGVVEAIEGCAGPSLVVGVQWHPELLPPASSEALFAHFVAACVRSRGRLP